MPIPVPSSNDDLWHTTIRWIVAAFVALLLAFLTYTREGWIPLLSGADLGVHEFGHLLTLWAPPLLCSFAGSFLQVMAPLSIAMYFFFIKQDPFAGLICTAWGAENLNNVSVYIADAQRMVLPLFGDDGSGSGHDWHNILSALGLLEHTDAIANVVRTGSIVLFILVLGLAALGFMRSPGRGTV